MPLVSTAGILLDASSISRMALKIPMKAQKVMPMFPRPFTLRCPRYPPKWAIGYGTRSHRGAGMKRLRYRSMSKFHVLALTRVMDDDESESLPALSFFSAADGIESMSSIQDHLKQSKNLENLENLENPGKYSPRKGRAW
jgi:hypothetical protein